MFLAECVSRFENFQKDQGISLMDNDEVEGTAAALRHIFLKQAGSLHSAWKIKQNSSHCEHKLL